MQPLFTQASALVLVALMLVAVLRWHLAVPILEGSPKAPWPTEADDEQPPETDRAPGKLWPVGLSAAVALTAALRVALLFTLHA